MAEGANNPQAIPLKNNHLVTPKQTSLLDGLTIIVSVIIGSGVILPVGSALLLWTFWLVISMVGVLCYGELGTMSSCDYDNLSSFLALLLLWVTVVIIKPCGQAVLAFISFMVLFFLFTTVASGASVPPGTDGNQLYVETEEENAHCLIHPDMSDVRPDRSGVSAVSCPEGYYVTGSESGPPCGLCPFDAQLKTYMPYRSYCGTCIICKGCPNGYEVAEECSRVSPTRCRAIEPDLPAVNVRLVYGEVQSEGIVQVFHNDVWRFICSDQWNINDAKVVCRQLSYPAATAAYTSAGPSGDDPIHLSGVNCVGTESSIFECPQHGVDGEECRSSKHAGARCGEKAEPSRGPTDDPGPRTAGDGCDSPPPDLLEPKVDEERSCNRFCKVLVSMLASVVPVLAIIYLCWRVKQLENEKAGRESAADDAQRMVRLRTQPAQRRSTVLDNANSDGQATTDLTEREGNDSSSGLGMSNGAGGLNGPSRPNSAGGLDDTSMPDESNAPKGAGVPNRSSVGSGAVSSNGFVESGGANDNSGPIGSNVPDGAGGPIGYSMGNGAGRLAESSKPSGELSSNGSIEPDWPIGSSHGPSGPGGPMVERAENGDQEELQTLVTPTLSVDEP